MIPPVIRGSSPAGGSPPYTYKWEKSYDKDFLVPILLVNDSDPLNYTPKTNESSASNDTVWFRRTITDSGSNTDVSSPVYFVIQQAVRNNIIVGSPDTLCFSSDPPLLQQGVPDLVVPSLKSLVFNWQLSKNSGSTWGGSLSSSNSYDPPPGLVADTWYRRTVSSGRCIDSSSVTKITVLPSINNNVTGSAGVCFNSPPVTLDGDPAAYGTNKYSFAWQDSSTITGWKNITAGGTNEDYMAPALVSARYRRIVFLGSSNQCKDTSKVLNVNVNPLPTSMILRTADTSICDGQDVRLKLRFTGGSPWNLVYNENLTGKPELRIYDSDTTILLRPLAVTGSASSLFKYSLKSVSDVNGCTSAPLTDTLRATVYRMPVAFAGQDAAVCGKVIKLQAGSDTGIGNWTLPAGAVVSAPDDPTATVTIDETFEGGSVTHKFIWDMTNWQCHSKDTVIVRFDKEVGPVSAGRDAAVYSFDNIVTLSATQLNVWETGKWSVITGTGELDDSEKNSTVVTDLSIGDNSFLWTVTNGICSNDDQLDLLVHEEFIPEGFSPNSDSFNNNFIISGLDLTHQTADLSIMNISGNQVFSSTNRDGKTWVDWDGSNSKGTTLPEGTYYYVLKVTSKLSGLVFKRSGFVLLKRF
jgi:gliding motility-associated-like protein